MTRALTVWGLERRLRKSPAGMCYVPDACSLLYVAASALPYHTSGYTTRTHEVVRALQQIGVRVRPMTRPGYPWDRRDRLAETENEQTWVGDVLYTHVRQPANNRPVLHYALQGASIVMQAALEHRAAAIHAASNHVNALPALLAARRLGIPFQYEMRGLWELTRVSRTPGYEGSQAYRQGLQLEGMVARHADRVFVISEQLGRYIQEKWGVARDRIFLLPNCVDPERFPQSSAQEVEPDSVGYAGSLIGYEGLDTLVDAMSLLKRSGRRVVLNLIGDGEARAQLEAQVSRLGLNEEVRFLGKLAPDVAQAQLRRSALVCIPRKPYEVCAIVPPIKLAEALALGKPVVLADLPVLRDEMGDDPAGWFFRPGDAQDLAHVLAGALRDGGRHRSIGERGRRYVVACRSWRDFVGKLLPMAQEGQ